MLSAGAMLGPYEVVSPLGAGGMGEVYRARDTKLGRDVALKVLPEAFTADSDRLSRFEREAKVLASLNHPNIGQIYGLEEGDGQQALVLELIEGPTLADRIAQGLIPLDEALPKVPSASGAPVAVHTTTPPSVNCGLTWAADDSVIVAASVNTGLHLGSVAGELQRTIGDWQPLTDITAPFQWPDALPDGRHVLFTDSRGERLEAARVAVLSLETGTVTPLGGGGTNPRYSPTGHILYGRGGSLYAVPFDGRRAGTAGAEVELLRGVMGDGNGSVQYAVGGNGTLAYVPGPPVAEYELVWIDRDGRTETLLESERPLFAPRLSPDATRLAVTVVDGANLDVWLFDLARRALTRRLTTHSGEDFGPVWHPDGTQLALSSEIDGGRPDRGWP